MENFEEFIKSYEMTMEQFEELSQYKQFILNTIYNNKIREEETKMQKVYIIPSYNGMEIIDNTPEAEQRLSAMDYIEERQRLRTERQKKRQTELMKNPLYKLACMCGIL